MTETASLPVLLRQEDVVVSSDNGLSILATRSRRDLVVERVSPPTGMPTEIVTALKDIAAHSFDQGYLSIVEINNKLAEHTGNSRNFRLIIEALRPCGIPFRTIGICDFSAEDTWNLFRIKTEVLDLSADLLNILVDSKLERVVPLISMTSSRLAVLGLENEMIQELTTQLGCVGLRLTGSDEKQFDYSRFQMTCPRL